MRRAVLILTLSGALAGCGATWNWDWRMVGEAWVESICHDNRIEDCPPPSRKTTPDKPVSHP